jgi:hypothetical protein
MALNGQEGPGVGRESREEDERRREGEGEEVEGWKIYNKT